MNGRGARRGAARGGSVAGKRVAILATDGFEQSELLEPYRALCEAGVAVDIVAPAGDPIQGMKHHQNGGKVAVDVTLADARPDDYDGLVLPGGVANPDALRTDRRAVDFVRGFVAAGKPIGAVCHGPWLLIEADAVRGRTLTSWPSLRTDLTNAGARWVDREAAVDGILVTSRNPGDLPAFCREFIVLLGSQARPQRQAAE